MVSGPYLRVLGVILFEVCMLCFTLPLLTVSLQIKHIGFVLPTGSTNAYFSVHSFLNSRFSVSTFLFLSCLEHAMIFQCKETDTVGKPLPLLRMTHTTCVTHR